MKHRVSSEFTPIENSPPLKISSEHSNVASEDDRKKSGITYEFSCVKIRPLQKGRTPEINIPCKDSCSKICNPSKHEFLKIYLWENKPLEI